MERIGTRAFYAFRIAARQGFCALVGGLQNITYTDGIIAL